MIEFGNIEVRDNGIEVLRADDYALVSLELIALSDQRLLHVKSARLGFCGIEYEVIGWDDRAKALQVARVTHDLPDCGCGKGDDCQEDTYGR